MERAHKIARMALFAFVLLLVLSFAIHRIESRDFGWLLKTGEHIYETRQAPHAELFSFTAEGNKYIDSHWLFQLLLYISYRVGGIPGATLFAAAILLVSFAAIYFAGYDKEKYVVAAALVVAGVVMASERFLVRPHLVTILFLSLYLLILERHRRRGGRIVLFLPCFQLLWVNMHGLFVLGLILPALYLACGLLQQKIRLPWEPNDSDEGLCRNDFIMLAAILPVLAFESFLSPYTIDAALYPLTLFEEVRSGTNVVAGSVAELSSPLQGADLSRSVRYFKFMVYLLPATFIFNWRRPNPTHMLLFAAFLYLGLIARRNLDLFAVIVTPIAVRNIGGFIDDLPQYFKRTNVSRALGIAQLAISPLIIVGIAYMILQIATDRYFIKDRDLTRFGFGIAKHAYPAKAADFIEAADIGGEMFNDPSIGGYLIWRFYPARKVYFDGRWEVYGNEFLENFKRVCSDPALFDTQAETMGIGYAIIPHSRGHLRRLIKHMTKSPDWALVYFDEVSMMFLRNTEGNAGVIEEYEVDPAAFESERDRHMGSLPADIEDHRYAGHDSALMRLMEKIPRLEYPYEDLARANFYFDFGYYDSAQALYEQCVGIYPDSEIAHDRLGRIFLKQKKYSHAMFEFEEVERLNPRSASNLIHLGYLNMAVGRLDRAGEYFSRAKKLERDNADVRMQLGRIYLFEGQKKKAARELRRALELNPDLKEALTLLEQAELP